MISKVLCWVVGHNQMTTNKKRVCLRCGARATLRRFGLLVAWEEVRGS
jgi:hypothetical protein